MAEKGTFEIIDKGTIRLDTGDIYLNTDRAKEELQSSIDNVNESLKWFLKGDRGQRYVQENRCYQALADIVTSGIRHVKTHEKGLFSRISKQNCPKIAVSIAKVALKKAYPEIRKAEKDEV